MKQLAGGERPPYRCSYDIDFIDSIFNIKSLGTRLYTRRSRLSVASVVQRRTARCNYIVNGPPINLLGRVERRQAVPASEARCAGHPSVWRSAPTRSRSMLQP